MEPAKDPDEVDKKPDKTCVEGHDRTAKTKDKEQLEGPHVLHNIKYGSKDLLGMKTKVTTVKGESTNSVGFGRFRSFMGSSKESEHDSI